MDYEKMYKEALERVRRLHDRMLVLSSTDALVASAELEFIFPELAESEDERIRKEIVNFFKNFKETGTWKSISDVNTWIAYLEKQKESLPISETCKENANSFTDGIIEVRSFQRGMEEGRKLEKQNEQKPVPFSCGHENDKPLDNWKPSEEQMSYLLSLHQGGEEQKPLRELIEQLKKLM